MSKESTLERRLYESGVSHERVVIVGNNDFEFPNKTRQVWLFGKAAATVFKCHLVGDPKDKTLEIPVPIGAFLQLNIRVDFVRHDTTCDVIGIS